MAACVIGVNHDASVRWIDCTGFLKPEMPVSQLITVQHVRSSRHAIGALLDSVVFENHDLIIVNGLEFKDGDERLWPGCFGVLKRHPHPRIIIVSDWLAGWYGVVAPLG